MIYPDDFINRIINGDCLKILPMIPDNSIDLVVTDPPYGITQNEWDEKPNWKIITKEFNRILNQNGQIIIFGRQPELIDVYNIFIQNFKFRYEIIWDKMQNMWTSNFEPLAIHENIFIFCHKKVKISNLTFNLKDLEFTDGTTKRRRIIKNDVLSSNQGKGWQKIYLSERIKKFPISILQHRSIKIGKEYVGFPTQKPVNIIKWFLIGLSNENDLILDPFLGSGTAAVACKKLNRNFIGIEISEKYCKIAEQRLKKVPERLDKFIGGKHG